MTIVSSSKLALVIALSLPTVVGCSEEPVIHDPDAAQHVSVDRFAEGVGHLQVRTAENGLPGPNEPVNFDEGPFITQGLSPEGKPVRYYNFDVQPLEPAPIYVLFREGESTPVEGQLNLIDVIPGDAGYSDFWQIHKVTVPSDYQANELASVTDLLEAGHDTAATEAIVNCPVVPAGSTAKLRAGGESAELHRGWYKGQVVEYFSFEEAPLTAASGKVPLSPIYVTFNVNPDPMNPASGPASGFVTEEGSSQTHNVTGSVPGDGGYSPLWQVSVYDNKDFASVKDYTSVTSATVLAEGVANVNCPVVEVQP